MVTARPGDEYVWGATLWERERGKGKNSEEGGKERGRIKKERAEGSQERRDKEVERESGRC